MTRRKSKARRQRERRHQGVAMGFVTGLLSGPKAMGFDVSEILERCGLSSEQIKRPDARVSLRDYAQLYNLVAGEIDDEALGLFSSPLRCGTIEFLVRGALASSNLAEALERQRRFLRLVLPDMAVSVERVGAHACLELTETGIGQKSKDDPRRIFAFEWFLRLIHAISCWLIDGNISLERVDFPYRQPHHSGDYSLIYTAHSAFSAPFLTARFDSSYLCAPIRQAETDITEFLAGGPGRITMLYRRDREIVRQVREVLAASLSSPPTLDEIASRLHMSTRSLQRQLANERSSLRAIKDAVRRDHAFAKLERTNEPISQIAAELGYSDSTAFYRAFYNWTEKSPKEFRAAVAVD